MCNTIKRTYNIIFILLGFLSFQQILAQNKWNAEIDDNIFSANNTQRLVIDDTIILNQDTISVLYKFLQKHLTGLNNKFISVKILKYKESPIGKHFLLQQYYHEIPLYNAFIKLNITHNGKVISLFNNSFNTNNYNLSKIKSNIELLKKQGVSFEKVYGEGKEIQLKEINIAVVSNNPEVVWHYNIHDANNHQFMQYLVDTNNDIIFKYNLNCNHRSTATASAYVHIPDPLTRANTFYTPPFVNGNNTTNASLDAQRILKDIEVTLNSGTYSLSNQYVSIQDFDVPFNTPSTSFVPEFLFNRTQSGFKEVNVLYHITEYQKYIQSLGFNNLATYQIQVDPHALNGDDNSLFSTATNPPRLFFGTGGVADAEDADVIIHEYCHALSNDANGSNFGNERRALDEGLCDYFATSYSKAIDTFRWQDMFTWDGHNEFWNGRTAATEKKYPIDLTTSIHANGEMWSTALMEIWDIIGSEITDKLMLQTLFGITSNITFKDAAKEFIKADSLLFNGEHFCDIYFPFLRRGLVDSLQTNPCLLIDKTITVNAGEDQIICYGDSVVIGNNLTNSPDNYLWQLANNIFISNEPNVKVSPLNNTDYIIKRTTSDGKYNTDTVTITIQICDIAIYNTSGFANGSEPLKLVVPVSLNNTDIKLFDINGKTIISIKQANNGIYYLSSNELSPGIYLLSLYNNKKPTTFKLVKAK
jgi:hypothetical protein